LFAIVRDITERKRAEEDLLRLSSAVRTSVDSIVLTDIEGRMIEVNGATLAMYGTNDEGDLIGKSAFELIVPEDREKAFAGMGEVLEKGYARGKEYRVISKNGGKIAVEMSVTLIRDAKGKPIGFAGINSGH